MVEAVQSAMTIIDAPIGQPYALESDKSVFFKTKPRLMARFAIRIDAPCIVRITVWRQTGESFPKLFVAMGNMRVSARKNQFKSILNKESQELVVYPDDPKFKFDTWYLAIEPSKDSHEHIFGIKVSLAEAKPITQLEPQVPRSVTVNDSAFFQTELRGDLENALFLLQLSTKRHLQVFVSKNCSYSGPGSGEHLLALGDLPDDLLFESSMKPHMLELLQDLTPFIFDQDEDRVKYQASYRHMNSDLFIAENQEKLDSQRLQRYTTWTQSHAADDDPLSKKTTLPTPEVADDRLNVFFSTAVWDSKNSKVNIGVYNVHPDGTPVSFEIKVRQQLFKSCLSPEMSLKSDVFDLVHDGTNAFDVSESDRSSMQLDSDAELTYGEVTFSHFVPILEYAYPRPGEVFWDLGCGAGRPLVSAALAFPQLSACKGVELLEQLAGLGTQIATRLGSICAEKQLSCAPVHVVKGDILSHDWYDADLIYLSAVCFSGELVIKVTDLLERVKPGTRIISLRQMPVRPNLQPFGQFEAKMSWGLGTVFYYKTV